MTLRRTTIAALVSASFLTLSACSSSDDSDDDNGGGTATELETGTGTETETETETETGTETETETETVTETQTTTETGSAGDDIDLTDATPRVITGACGTMSIAETAVSTDLASPATMLEGMLVRGRIDPDITSNQTHYWQIDLAAGYHHVIIDSSRTDSTSSNLGVEINEVDSFGDSEQRLAFGNEVGFNTRVVDFFVNPEPRTLILEVTPVHGAEDYVFGVFANGRSIPSPRFEDCFESTPLSLGTTEAVRLNDVDSPDDFAWYVTDLEAGSYLFEGVTSRVDGVDSNIGYTAKYFSRFGEADTESTIIFVNERGSVSTDEEAFVLPESLAGESWMRLEGLFTEEDLQFTITEN